MKSYLEKGSNAEMWNMREHLPFDSWLNAVRWSDDNVRDIILGFRERGLENETLFMMYLPYSPSVHSPISPFQDKADIQSRRPRHPVHRQLAHAGQQPTQRTLPRPLHAIQSANQKPH